MTHWKKTKLKSKNITITLKGEKPDRTNFISYNLDKRFRFCLKKNNNSSVIIPVR